MLYIFIMQKLMRHNTVQEDNLTATAGSEPCLQSFISVDSSFHLRLSSFQTGTVTEKQ